MNNNNNEMDKLQLEKYRLQQELARIEIAETKAKIEALKKAQAPTKTPKELTEEEKAKKAKDDKNFVFGTVCVFVFFLVVFGIGVPLLLTTEIGTQIFWYVFGIPTIILGVLGLIGIRF